MALVTLTNQMIAEIQIDRAITLWINEKDYVSSLTLAGAAEEILGKCLEKKGLDHALKEAIKASQLLEKKLTGSASKDKDVAHVANFFKNRLKHYSDNEPFNFRADHYSADIIERAISNYFKLTGKLTNDMKRFDSNKRND